MITIKHELPQEYKLQDLEFQDYFDIVEISKSFRSIGPKTKIFQYFETLGGAEGHYMYVGLHTSKDVITLNPLGWIIVCLKRTKFIFFMNNHLKEIRQNNQKLLVIICLNLIIL